jgi:hypothetical protein
MRDKALPFYPAGRVLMATARSKMINGAVLTAGLLYFYALQKNHYYETKIVACRRLHHRYINFGKRAN